MEQRITRRKGARISVAEMACAVVLAALAVAAFSARPLAAADGNYHLLKKVVLGGEGFWDYLICDSDARRVYISRGTHVMVVDADSYAVVGDIPGTDGVHGIALAPEFGRGFTSNGRANTVTIFDLKTLKVLGTAPTGEGPDAIVYDPASKRVFTLNGHGGTPRPSMRPRENPPERSRWEAGRNSPPRTGRGTSTTTWKTRANSSRSIRRSSR